ncbi:thiamine diphosphokinase [Oceanobacillus piezotolerans]|uniref:Thiamine diphosphokinase n=1 Tax=Oceanobacillus piezotolerans TaxID=2448030 RepID=A0A498DIF0_9BACI|nr:thiamine diphosphokinase [Oceanobacillus piezotolerans]RLL45275.1 thiamine diphosphokinase [Oceanobacillus piezotolerans]
MAIIGIVANGPSSSLPELSDFTNVVDYWIGADRGAFMLAKKAIKMEYAIGDFDSISDQEKLEIKKYTEHYKEYPIEKDKTDLELAIDKALEKNPSRIYLFGVTGGRIDHELANIQLLYLIRKQEIQAIMVDRFNYMELTFPGTYHIKNNDHYDNISFIPFTLEVKRLTLTGFYYPLTNYDLSWGSTRCISNKLLSNSGTFSYDQGILIFIKSRNVI